MRSAALVCLLAACALAAWVLYADARHRAASARARRRRIARLRARLMLQKPQQQAEAPLDIEQGLREKHRAFVAGDWTALLEIGDVYRKGAYPTHRPDTDVALRVYRAACGSPDAAVAGAAQTRFLECRADILAAEDVAGASLPGAVAEACIAHAAGEMGLGTPAHRPLAVSVQMPSAPRVPLPPAPAAEPVIVTSDAQNVHDHSVTQGLKRALREMSARGDALEDVTMHVLDSGATPEDKTHALEVLDTLSAEGHSTLGESERAALNKVWARIQDLPTPDARRDAADILTSQLASGVERGSVVCSTGKIARIMSTLDGLTPEAPVVKPMWAVREELGTMAARIRDRVDDPEAAHAEFARAATQTYVDDLGLSEDLVGAIVTEYASGFA